MTWETVGPILAALGGGGAITALWREVAHRRTIRAKAAADVERAEIDAAQVLSDAAIRLLAPLQEQVTHLKNELAESRTELRELGTYVELLISELRAAQVPVPPRPDNR